MKVIGLSKLLKGCCIFPVKAIYFIVPGKKLSIGLKEIKSDVDLAELIALGTMNGNVIDLYLEHNGDLEEGRSGGKKGNWPHMKGKAKCVKIGSPSKKDNAKGVKIGSPKKKGKDVKITSPSNKGKDVETDSPRKKGKGVHVDLPRGSDEEEEAKAFNLMARNFRKFFRNGNRLGHDNQFGNGANRFGRGHEKSFRNKGGETPKQKGACYNYGIEGHFASEYRKPKENKAFVRGAWSDIEDGNEP
nr:60S ribosomal protein L34 [Tanacetum cinerariifolium]